MREWAAVVRERLEAEGQRPDLHLDAIDELAAHLGDVYRGARQAGQTDADAIAAAQAELDGLGPLAAAIAARRAAPFSGSRPTRRASIGSLGADVRQAFRMIPRRPGVSALVILTLAIGIGACTAVFTLFNAVLLGTLPYPDGDRLVLLWEGERDTPNVSTIVAAPVYEDWRQMNRSLESIGIFENLTFNIAAGDEPEQVTGVRASPSLFDVLKVAPALGRTFRPDEDAPGHAVAVISDAVWRSQFDRAADVLGRSIRLNGAAHEVIGVMPAGIEFPRQGAGIWVPMAFTERDRERDSHSFYVVGRLKSDVTFAEAQAELAGIGEVLAARHIENRHETTVATPMSEFGLRRVSQMLNVLFGAVAFVLAIACVNVANLQMSQALARQREFVMRMTLGAGLGRLTRQLTLEGLALAVCGGVGGLIIAWLGTRAVGAILGPQFFSFWFRGPAAVAIDGRVLAFAAGISLVCALVFSLAPLLTLRRGGLAPALHDGARGAVRSALGLRRVLVALEVTLAIVVLSGAGLLIKSLSKLMDVDAGLDPARVITLQVSLPQAETYGAAERATFCEDLARSAAATPLFTSTGAISHLPLSGANAGRGFTIEGRPEPASPNDGASANYRISCPGYFATLGIPIVRGRDFTAADRRQGAHVVIVNRVVAERYWPGEDPIGQRLKTGGYASTNPWLTVVGIADNVRHFALEDEPRREIFVPYGQASWPVMTLVAKTRGEITPAATRELREVLRRIDPSLPPAIQRTMTAVVEGSVNWRQSIMRLLGIFAGVGLILAGVGVYGVLSYYVSQRTREIGVRMALGATRALVVRLVLGQMSAPMIVGVVLGVAGSIWTGRLLTGLLYNVSPGDPLVSGVIVGVLVVVGLVASWLPVRRAAAIDPVVALRED
ncbi:MAG TPA: ABC transporter permease [Vicinamibacterales bacterium]|nr:ABC transporter permease [Vicinamibacterales bacterium]